MKLSSSALCAFTLMEMLSVIAIILVLSSVVMLSVSGVTESAQRARAERNAALLNEAIEKYSAKGGDLSSIIATPAFGSTTTGDSAAVSGVVNTLRSMHANMVRMGGPFIDAGMSPILTNTGWRTYLVGRVVQTNARTQLYFDITNSGSVVGVTGFEPGSSVNMGVPIGSMIYSTTQYTSGGAPPLPTSTALPAATPVPQARFSDDFY